MRSVTSILFGSNFADESLTKSSPTARASGEVHEPLQDLAQLAEVIGQPC